MQSRQNFLYRLLDKDHYESFNGYVPQKKDFYDLVASRLPFGWYIHRKDIWFHCTSPRNSTPRQGWKIHVSATLANAREVMTRVAMRLFERQEADFKFAVDLSVLFLLNSKNWPRGGSGKFITIYPRDNHRFLELIDLIYSATRDLKGPYILSDHCYKDSATVFYRYGGMWLNDAVNVKGEHVPMLIGPEGTELPDERQPYPLTPDWADAVLPVTESQGPSQADHSLKNGRYKIEAALSFSNAGGVYRGFDRESGNRVVIKEARPLINATADGYDAVDLLKKEFRLLNVIADTGIAPQPLDLFQEWEHWFLVEEYIDGIPLGAHSAEHNVLLRTKPTPESFEQWNRTVRSVCEQLLRTVQTLHDHSIVFSDFSPNNLIVQSASEKLKVIDFEGAYQIGVDRASSLYTPGFVSQNRLAGSDAATEDDYYAVGAVLMAYLFPVTNFFHLRPAAKQEIMANIQRDAHLPEGVTRLVLGMMDQDPARRQPPASISEVLEPSVTATRDPEPVQAPHDYRTVIAGVVAHLNHVASTARRDRLFPADPKVFTTNPLSLAYGACGVGYALSKITNGSQESVADWIVSHTITAETYAPGLYLGISGIAWGLLEMGRREAAEKIFRCTRHHRLLDQSMDIFYGLAGWGMANLRFFLETGDEFYLSQATEAGDRLVGSSQRCDNRRYWGSMEETSVGFAHGASGIAVFLLYLYLASGREYFVSAGQQALEFDLNLGVRTKDSGLSWRESARPGATLYPYWRFGSAGVGVALVRFWRVLGNARYRMLLEDVLLDTDRKYAVFPGKFMGLAGLGDFLLDVHELTGESSFLSAAHRVAEGIMQFRVERQGIAFPGDMLSRLSCDYGTGSAGIALFLNRFLGARGSDFMLDSLFESRSETNVRPEGSCKPDPYEY
jgi:serine/threonine protein kinase